MKTPVELFKEDLEVVLDEHFPKIHEEGPDKVANKRGPALALFAEAVLGAQKIVKAFGGCHRCYGKGYGTETTFAVGRRTIEKMPTINLCSCERGTQLGDLIEAGL